jgi:hypothetical protein
MPRDNPLTKEDLLRVMEGKSDEERLQFLLETRFPESNIKIEKFNITIPKGEEPSGVIVKKWDRGSTIGRTDMKTIYVTRGLVGDIAFHFEDEWSQSENNVMFEVADKIEELKK